MKKAKCDGETAVAEFKAGELRDSWNMLDMGEVDGGHAVVIYVRPDFLLHPITKERLDVTGEYQHRGPCHKCGGEAEGVRVLVTEPGIAVYECPSCQGFIWFQKKGG